MITEKQKLGVATTNYNVFCLAYGSINVGTDVCDWNRAVRAFNAYFNLNRTGFLCILSSQLLELTGSNVKDRRKKPSQPCN